MAISRRVVRVMIAVVLQPTGCGGALSEFMLSSRRERIAIRSGTLRKLSRRLGLYKRVVS